MPLIETEEKLAVNTYTREPDALTTVFIFLLQQQKKAITIQVPMLFKKTHRS